MKRSMKRTMKRTQNRRKRMTRSRGTKKGGFYRTFIKWTDPDRYYNTFNDDGSRKDPNFAKPKIFEPIYEEFKEMFRKNNEKFKNMFRRNNE